MGGWLEIKFEEPVAGRSRFSLTYEGYGTHETLVWGGGQLFLMRRNRLTPMLMMPGGAPGVNVGILNLDTGRVEEGSAVLCATFQNTLIAEVGALNRLPFSFPFVFPPPDLPMPMPEADAPHVEQPTPAYAHLEFGATAEGQITSFSLRSETNVPVSIFPFLGLFPPFAFGADGRFFFGHPTHYLPDTPLRNMRVPGRERDGIHLPPPASFHPHLVLYADRLEEPCDIVRLPSSAPVARYGVSGLIDGELIVAGGSRSGRTIGDSFACAVGSEEWRALPPMPIPVAGAGCGVRDNKLYVIGGEDAAGWPLSSVQIYNPEFGSWLSGPELPAPMAFGSVAVVDDQIVVAGGWSSRAADRVPTDAVFFLDAGAASWTVGPPMLLPVAHAAHAVVGGELWVVNGAVDDEHLTPRCSSFSLKKNRWGIVPETETAVAGATLVCRLDSVFRLGGQTQAGLAVEDVEEFDLATKRWCPSAPIAVATVGASGIALSDGRALLMGAIGSTDVAESSASFPIQFVGESGGWSTPPGPAFSAQDVFSGSAGCVAPRNLAPGGRAMIVSRSLQGEGDATFSVNGLPARVLREANGLAEILVPEFPVTAPRECNFKGAWGGTSIDFPILIRRSSPSLYLLNYAAIQSDAWVYDEFDYLNRASVLARNEDGSLNFPGQPAAPQEALALFATGLSNAERAAVFFNDQEIPARLEKAPGLPGVVLIHITIPAGAVDAESSPTLQEVAVEADGCLSNRATVSVARRSGLGRPVPVEGGLQTVFGPAIS
ncbi:hypothetical protein [Mesorhizobium sp. CO1-1-4]|uniref:hypothetical protein n=1 Tax=Mesorhizobium sp. CO1-1-4 TaxID=2876633 RepID=UPI001CC9388B|nr:hypothetical protein [Mesorhizobium sp. CO1-1-4]MBZ9740638.1 hypothetical protein [Mesorhizobium sp. CO1-1-4]